jgi:hypothetical protein
MAIEKKKSGRTAYPVGHPFPRFPLLTEMTFGLQGIFALYGGTGIGKSTLAANLAADVVAEDFPVVYYDGENTFFTEAGTEDSLTASRISQMYDPTASRFNHFLIESDYQKAVNQLATLQRGLFVVDTVQSSIGADGADRDGGVRDALTARMSELAQLARQYPILLVSQVNNRSAQAPQPLSAMKGASAIEQGLWTAVAYGVEGDHRVLVLRKLKRPTAKMWPLGSKIIVRSDGADRLTESSAASTPRPRSETPAERLARVQAANPGASRRAVARLAGVPWTSANRLLGVVHPLVHGPVVDQSMDQG